MNSRRKATVVVAIVGAVITLASLWVVFQAYQTPIDYWIEGSDTLSKGLASVAIYCTNSGSADVEFNLVLTLANLTFSDQSHPTAASTVQTVLVMEFRFMLHKGESTQETAYFLTNETGSEFRLTLSLEKINFWDTVRGNGLFPTSLEYQWNEQNGSYIRLWQLQYVF
jgi:hypothetical protein